MITVGIVGNGFVGESQIFAFSPTNEIRVYDIDPLKSTHRKEETHKSDFIFVCVPTPMNTDGRQDLSFIEKVFEESVEGPIYIIKSTVLPGTTEKLQEKYAESLVVIGFPANDFKGQETKDNETIAAFCKKRFCKLL